MPLGDVYTSWKRMHSSLAKEKRPELLSTFALADSCYFVESAFWYIARESPQLTYVIKLDDMMSY